MIQGGFLHRDMYFQDDRSSRKINKMNQNEHVKKLLGTSIDDWADWVTASVNSAAYLVRSRTSVRQRLKVRYVTHITSNNIECI